MPDDTPDDGQQSLEPWKPTWSLLDHIQKGVKAVDEFGRKYSPKTIGESPIIPSYETLSDFVGVPAAARTIERAAYGENPITTGRGQTTRIRDDALDSAAIIVPAVGKAYKPFYKMAEALQAEAKATPGTVRMFMGPKAKGANLDMLEKAKNLEAEGKGMEDIRQDTGWRKGDDGKWRYEISDREAVSKITSMWDKKKKSLEDQIKAHFDAGTLQGFVGKPTMAEKVIAYKRLMGKDPHPDAPSLAQKLPAEELASRHASFLEKLNEPIHTTWGDAINHPEFFASYPHLKDKPFTIDPNLKTAGSYLESKGHISINPYSVENTPGQDKKFALHEMMHAVQREEGFAPGTNPLSIAREHDRIRDAQEQKHKSDVNIYSTAAEVRKFMDEHGVDARTALQVIVDTDRHTGSRGLYQMDSVKNRIVGLTEHSKQSPESLERLAKKSEELRTSVPPRMTPEEAHRSYLNQHGEVEARNVEARSEMTRSQREYQRPSMTQDISRDQTELPKNWNPNLTIGNPSSTAANERPPSGNKHVVAGLREIALDDDIALEYPNRAGSFMISGIHRTGDKGHASDALKRITSWADRNGKQLVLMPSGSGEMSTEQLREWYVRNGFELKPDGAMVRKAVKP